MNLFIKFPPHQTPRVSPSLQCSHTGGGAEESHSEEEVYQGREDGRPSGGQRQGNLPVRQPGL